jgi:hypothetical protein
MEMRVENEEIRYPIEGNHHGFYDHSSFHQKQQENRHQQPDDPIFRPDCVQVSHSRLPVLYLQKPSPSQVHFQQLQRLKRALLHHP